MYRASSKLGRGGGGAAARGGGAKRTHSSFPPPSNRSSGGRLSVGGSSGGTSGAPASTEETFSLVPGKSPLGFGMIIRLTPDLVEEIRRVEAQGETPRMKFDANAKNTDGNVINVGGKEFRFTWSREPADLCDIYEQRQSGEEGNGLLVESGSAWRKVNVQRVLDKSTTNHVKMRSEEAERKLKSRKAIILDHGNPSMKKNQMKVSTAVETNTWRNFKQKKEPPMKKQKVEPLQGGPPKPVIKPALASATVAKSRRSASPLPSSPAQFGAPASPFGTVKLAKSHLNIEEIMPSQMTNKETATSSEKEIPSKARETPLHKGNFGAKPKDLQSLLISLLTENPKGMSLKALEKAVGDTIPNPTKKIEPVIKRIATFQAPGRYILKPGVDESFRKPSSDDGSSPDDSHHQTPAPEVNEKPAPEDKYDQTPARQSSFDGNVPTGGLEEQTQLNKFEDELNSTEHVDILQNSPNLGGNSDRQASSSSSGSDSDSDSDSSDSGSRSKSKSRSPAGSGSGSSSDSESDASSNSKEGSDEDVDIMTSDDDKETKHKSKASEPGWDTPDGNAVRNGDAREREAIEVVEKNLSGEGHKAEMLSVPSSVSRVMTTDPDDSRDCQNIIEQLFEDEENGEKDSFKLEKCASSERISKGKSKRGSDSNHFDRISEHAKRLKAENLAQLPESPHILSPGGNTEFGMQKGYLQAVPVKSSSDFNQLGQRSTDESTQCKVHDTAGRSDKHAEILGHGRKYSNKSAQQESLSIVKDKAFRDTSNEDGYGNERKAPSNLKEDNGGSKYGLPSDSHYRKHSEVAGEVKEPGQIPNSHIGLFPNDSRSSVNRSPLVNGRGSFLQRELSDLELGELREPVLEQPPPKKQFERKKSFKQTENRLNSSEYWNFDPHGGKSIGRTTLDSGKPSPPNYNSGVHGSLETLNRKKTPEHVEAVTRSHHQALQSQGHNVSRTDHADVRSQFNKSRQNESAVVQGIDMEGYGESHKKAPACAPQYHDIGREPESNCPYSKYEKDKPELKGPIKDFSQYNEYVQEYREKYDSYCSLNKILESDRMEFQKFGKDLAFAKDRDMDRYHSISLKLKESYQQCGERHKRLKKIFIVLHEELKHLKHRIKDYAFSCTKD